MSGVPRQLETFEVAGKLERDMGCHVTKSGRLSPADITQATLTRCYTTGEGVDNISVFVFTWDAPQTENPPALVAL
jgi:hypothetical protein